MKRALFTWTTALLVTAGMTMLAGGPAFAAAHAAGVTPASDTKCSTAYFDNNSLLGPRILPAGGQVAPIVQEYRRLAGMTASKFLAKYWDASANGGKGSWRYPPDNGFLIADDHPVEFPSALLRGEDVDRFGSEYGGFLAPADTPYANRSIPPQSLDDFDSAFTCNYHLYRVLKPFKAETGPIAPAFGQPGLGLQYQLVSFLLPGDPGTANVMWLISNGYLKRLN
jgi:Tuberculosis necrotizing toxin